ncbi:hypothetical protein [Saccharopolyspora hattusasensis]|uniref:hypothetical protein n=1 Tax=Saccharopolyspora hattusasensis TaxID=1128679 RepID=UPI003D96F309
MRGPRLSALEKLRLVLLLVRRLQKLRLVLLLVRRLQKLRLVPLPVCRLLENSRGPRRPPSGQT